MLIRCAALRTQSDNDESGFFSLSPTRKFMPIGRRFSAYRPANELFLVMPTVGQAGSATPR